jgi:hypothetical protein
MACLQVKPFHTAESMSKARTFRGYCWWIVPVVVLALVAVRIAERASLMRDLANFEQQGMYPIQPDPHSQTGYQWGQRRQILSPDGYHWVMQTQRMLAEGVWRLREVDYDNHPYGREVHWSSGLHWWLGGLAWLWSNVAGCPLPIAVEEVAPYANPLLLVGLILILVPLVWRWFGRVSAGCVALGLATVAPFCELFALADPDHHGLVAACGLFTVLFLVVGGGGWVKRESDGGVADRENTGLRSYPQARRFFIASGVAGGAGLWLSSATQVPILIGIGLGVVIGVWRFGRKEAQKNIPGLLSPELWRWWGVAGASASIFFYLLEYFPSHLGFRLEVNHPLYAFAWLGGGEILARWSRLKAGGGFATPGRDQAVAVGAVLGVVLLPLVVLTTAEQTFWVSDRILWALHADYIMEFGSVFRQLGMVPLSRWLFIINPLPVLALALCWHLFGRDLAGPWKARLLIALIPAALVLLLALYQVRWMGISCALWFVVLAAAVGLIVQGGGLANMSPRLKVALAVLALTVPTPWMVQLVHTGAAVLGGKHGFSELNLRLNDMRDLARWLRMREGGGREGVILAGPGVTTALIYHGGFKGVGTLYWENKDGLKSMIDIFSTSNDSVAKELIKQHGVTHVVVVSWDSFAAEASRLTLGLRRNDAAPEDSFLARLSKGHGCPFWLRPVHYPELAPKPVKGDSVLVYEVVPEMSREEAALRYAQLLFERGEQVDAEKFLNLLVRHYTDYLPGWVALAQVQAGLNRVEAFRASVRRIAALQSQAQGLALDDRIGLATVFAMAEDLESMRKHTRACLDSADEKALRRLSANLLLNFILLAQDTGEAPSRPALMRQATELLPGYMQKQVPVLPGAQ